MCNRISDALRKVWKVADYQFGKGVGEKLFPQNVTIMCSRKTGKIRYVNLDGKLLATLKPTNGFFSLTFEGAKRFVEATQHKRLWIKVQEDAAAFAKKGNDVFARHVTNVDEEIRPGEEVVVFNCENNVVAVGKAVLSGKEMKSFRRGIAVKVRKGSSEKIKKGEREIVNE